ncbi:MAG: hypothetical protein D6806_10460 [Deltaproteobacteria bacterium]|nr:MAG: hypothetical protein D6806_10460 [Deltaproteobacteria bacterium]
MMRVYDPKGRLLVRLDKARFRLLRRKGKPDKKVFMQDVDVEGRIPDGWYRIEVEDNNGNIHRGWDYVLGVRLQRAEGMRPSGDEALRSPPVLQWSDVPGAAFYQVFVYDAWTESVKYTSPLITEPRLDLSKAGLEPEYYYWRVHARDVNGHVLLGDFQSGSMSGRAYFSLLPE